MAKTLMKGNEAMAEAAIRCGCKLYFGYPITPQSDLPEYMAANLPKAGGVFLQPESEVSVINMLGGAWATGTRAMTSTSSPGVALMQENISNLAGSEIPCVVVNVCRGGPGAGNLSANQGDYNQATRGGGNGDYHMLVVSPGSVQEACDLVQRAFDLAEKYRNPVMVLTDAMMGQMMEAVDIPYVTPPETDKSWAAVGYSDKSRKRAQLGSLYFDEPNCERAILKMREKYARAAREDTLWEEYLTEDAEYLLVAYGVASRLAFAAVDLLREAGIKAGLFRPISLYPYPSEQLRVAAGRSCVKSVITVEMSDGQMHQDVLISLQGLKPTYLYNRVGGYMPMPEDIVSFVKGLS